MLFSPTAELCRTCAALASPALRANLLAQAAEVERCQKDAARMVIAAKKLLRQLDAEMAKAAKAAKADDLSLAAAGGVTADDLAWMRQQENRRLERQRRKQIAAAGHV